MIPFSPPSLSEEAIKNVVEVLESGWITTGPKTKLFEQKITEYCGNKRTLCLNSATAGLEIILRWFDVQEGDEVILPAYTYSATANVIMHCGAKPVFVDVNKSDFNINIEAIEKAITEKTKVIMPVDFGGLPCDYTEINQLVETKKSLFTANTEVQNKLGRILVLADAAHSFGATYNGKKSGSLTDVSVFSFHAVKNLTTAEGGAVTLNLPEPFYNDEVYDYLCVKTLHGQNKDALAKSKKGNWRYDIIEAGFKCNMTDISAAIGLAELKRYESETLKKRKEICDYYNSELSKYDWATVPVFENNQKTSSYHLYPLRINGISENTRNEIIQMIVDKNVSVNVHFYPVPGMSFYKKLGYSLQDYPTTFDNYSKEISLPVYFSLSKHDMEEVIKTVVSSVEEILK